MDKPQWTTTKPYIIQFGQDRFPNGIDKLPADIFSLEKGQWIWSNVLQGWVGYNLTEQENRILYERGIG